MFFHTNWFQHETGLDHIAQFNQFKLDVIHVECSLVLLALFLLDVSNTLVRPPSFLIVSHALVQMWRPSGSLHLPSGLSCDVSMSSWLLLPPPGILGPV